MTFGEVCTHGSLKRQCRNCELIERLNALVADADRTEKQLQAADKLAEAAKVAEIVRRQIDITNKVSVAFDLIEWFRKDWGSVLDALAAYEKVRGK